jgi:outer membrane protein OmpA-like peptidoglycan-associated protein
MHARSQEPASPSASRTQLATSSGSSEAAVDGSAAAREPWLLDLEATGGAPISSPQRDWFGGGGSLAIGVSRPLAPWLLIDARLRTALFLDGDAPDPAGVRDPDFGTLNSLTVGAVVRLPDGSARRATGPWAGASIGGGLTGKEARATWEAALGYGFALSDTSALGPIVRYVQVIQPDSQLAPSDARIILAGVRLSLFDAPPEKPKTVAPTRSDRDGDGIADERDRCVEIAEDTDNFEDEDGCPESDNDQDGVPDASDGCPNIPEDKDGFQDEDGCPDDDNDKDGVLDPDDQCPLEPETINGERDDDGCPDQGLIEMHNDRVVLQERVLFDTNSARVKASAEPVLRAIVKLYSQHPEWTKVRIEGHADPRGDERFNQQLSEHRATNVREALIAMGIKPAAAVAQGYGSTRLLNSGSAEEELAKNRRVEFVVIARVAESSAPLFSPTTAGAPLVPAPGPELEAPASDAPASAAPAPTKRKPTQKGQQP